MKMQEVVYLPLDLPILKISQELFLEHSFNPRASSVRKGWPDYDLLVVPLHGASVYLSNNVQFQKSRSDFYWLPKSNYFGSVKRWIIDNLPFTSLRLVTLISSYEDLPFHRDNPCYYADNPSLPALYRAVVMGVDFFEMKITPFENYDFQAETRLKSTSMVKKIDLPDCSNSFVLNDYHICHSTKFIGKPKIMLIIDGEIDYNRHVDILNRSKKKYEKYMIKKCSFYDC